MPILKMCFMIIKHTGVKDQNVTPLSKIVYIM